MNYKISKETWDKLRKICSALFMFPPKYYKIKHFNNKQKLREILLEEGIDIDRMTNPQNAEFSVN